MQKRFLVRFMEHFRRLPAMAAKRKNCKRYISIDFQKLSHGGQIIANIINYYSYLFERQRHLINLRNKDIFFLFYRLCFLGHRSFFYWLRFFRFWRNYFRRFHLPCWCFRWPYLHRLFLKLQRIDDGRNRYNYQRYNQPGGKAFFGLLGQFFKLLFLNTISLSKDN